MELSEKYNVVPLDDGNLLITSAKTHHRWITRIKGKKTLIMQTTGKIADDSMYNLYGKAKPGGTLYSFYYETPYEFSGHQLTVNGLRVYHNFREGDFFESENFTPREPDGYAFYGQNTSEIGGSPVKRVNPQLDWFAYRSGWIMYCDRINDTVMFRKRCGENMNCLEDIEEDTDDPLDAQMIAKLKTNVREQPCDMFELLPEPIREEFKEVLEVTKMYQSTSPRNKR